MSTPRPTLDLDLFSDDAIRDPVPRYRVLRDHGPAAWLPALGVWALGRYDDVRAALRADDVLVSGQGVALSDFLNRNPGRTTLISDGELHRRRRSVLIKPMLPRALAEVRPRIEALAHDLVRDLRGKPSFDGIADFARHLPVSIVSHLVGLPEQGRERMLEWAAATFNALGPANALAEQSGPALLDMLRYAANVDRDTLRPDGWAARVFAAADEGRIDPEDARGLMIDYIAPSLDTTLLGIGSMLHLLGTHPEQYARLRADPARIPAAVHESLRHGSPVRGFTRVAASAWRAGDVSIPAGERVLILYGSANRDERQYADPDRFDVDRDARDHLALGHGVHRCAGGHLAQLEMESLLRALVAQVERIEVGPAEPLLSNMLHGPARFDASFR